MKLKLVAVLSFLMLFFFQSYGLKKDATGFSSTNIAKTHSIVVDKPVFNFFEGALLGNGGMGVVLTTRPDAVVLYFGHNDVWDIRLSEKNKEQIGTFQDVFERVKSIPDSLEWLTQDSWYNSYNQMTGENYSYPYPRPFPCGSVLIGFDRRDVELTGHRLDISNGMCEISFLKNNQKLILQVFVDMQEDRLWMQLVDENNQLAKNIFSRIRLMPDPSTPAEFPLFEGSENLNEGELAFRQQLPCRINQDEKILAKPEKDEAFKTTIKIDGRMEKTSRLNWNGNKENMAFLEAALMSDGNFIGYVSVENGLNKEVPSVSEEVEKPTPQDLSKTWFNNIEKWNSFWEKSGVKLADHFLEQIWYRNLYFFNCSVKEGVRTPGIFANWSYNRIGTSWHGDYHMNYNTQQPFWLTFSSNHLEKNLSYVSLIEHMMPVSKIWAKEYYGLDGAYFPHSAYPVDMTMNPYPVPDWGWEICETPWAVQGLWWHYLYSGDLDFLRTRAYLPMKEAVQFLVSYMNRSEARNNNRWKDNKYHIFPSIPPELYGLRPGFQYNYDCSMDLALTRFIFNAFTKATQLLKTTQQEENLLKSIREIQNNFPNYPKTTSKRFGEVLVSVPEEYDEVVYNVPANLASVFPGEDIGLSDKNGMLRIARSTYLNQQNEGGNDLVFSNFQAARLGMLNLEKFKRQVNYCLLPNGTASDRILQVHGRYNDLTDFGYMDPMGIWFENFALPVVINECLMQSYDGTIRLFPNWDMQIDASFNQLRAAGAFLVSAKIEDGEIETVRVLSEKGNDLMIMLPWGKSRCKQGDQVQRFKKELISIPTEPGKTYVFSKR